MDTGAVQESSVNTAAGPAFVVRWLGAVLLFLVGYIHLALLVNVFGLAHTVGKLFLLNAIGAFAAAVLVVVRPQWYGWVLGILVSGGAAFAKLGMNTIPGLRSFIMGGAFGPGRFGRAGFRRGARPPGGFGAGKSAAGKGFAGKGGGGFQNAAGAHAGHFGPAGHTILPTFANMRALGSGSVVVEIGFVVLAVVVLVTSILRMSGQAASTN